MLFAQIHLIFRVGKKKSQTMRCLKIPNPIYCSQLDVQKQLDSCTRYTDTLRQIFG